MKKIVTIAAMTAFAGAAFGQAFSEDFEGGIPGSWTVIDNEGSGMVFMTNADWGSGNYTNGSGLAAATESDAFGPAAYDTELVTHSFNVPNGASLDATINYQNLANLDFFDIDINTGSGWVNLLSWNEDHGGFYSTPGEDVSLDLSGYAGENAQVRFHHYNPNDGDDWDWYVQIDNVVVTPAPGAAALLGLGGLVAARRRR